MTGFKELLVSGVMSDSGKSNHRWKDGISRISMDSLKMVFLALTLTIFLYIQFCNL